MDQILLELIEDQQHRPSQVTAGPAKRFVEWLGRQRVECFS